MKIFNFKTLNFLINNCKADKCGYLLKKSSESKKSYQLRYFILIGNLFIYFEKLPTVETEALGVILLEKYVVEIYDDPKQEFAFQIKLGVDDEKSSKNYIFASESEGDLKDWFRVLITAGSEYFTVKEEELQNQVKALREIISCQYSKDKTAKIFSREYNPFGGPETEKIDANLRCLLLMTFDEMHCEARENILNID